MKQTNEEIYNSVITSAVYKKIYALLDAEINTTSPAIKLLPALNDEQSDIHVYTIYNFIYKMNKEIYFNVYWQGGKNQISS